VLGIVGEMRELSANELDAVNGGRFSLAASLSVPVNSNGNWSVSPRRGGI